MIKVIDIADKANTQTPEGHVRRVLGSSDEGTRVEVEIREVDAGKTWRLDRGDRTRVAYVL